MNREKDIFERALDLASVEERMAFLQGACGGDAARLDRLLGLLQASEGAGEFLPEVPQAGATMKLDLPASGEEILGSRIGHYKLLQKVGEGGYGVVYMAEQEEPVRRRVALKVIKLGMDTRSVVARFEAERQALAMMDHPNIARVLDAGTTDKGRPFFVMDLVRGIRITDYCDQNHLSTEARLELFITVCQAVQHAHQKGIIHRDLKPSNILVTLHDGVPVPKVIDFGIAKVIERKLTEKTLFTELHQLMGTPAYMSPEQAEMSGLDIDTRSDIYSLGVLLYELLTGRTPFDTSEMIKDGLDALRRTIREVEPPRPSTRLSTLAHADLDTVARARGTGAVHLRLRLRGDLDWIVMKCLEKDRTRRYDTANGLANDLKRHLQHEPVIARPPSAGYRLQKAIRRNKLGFTAATAVALALVLGSGVSTWQAFLARRAQRETEAARHGERQQRLEAQSAQKTAETEGQRAEANAQKFRNASIQSRRSQYAADMFAATAEIEKGSYGNARNFLREYFPRDGVEELRGFEWRYLWQMSAGLQLKTFPIPREALAIAWSPDERLIAAGSTDRTVKLLRSDTGEVVSVLTNGSEWHVSVAFSHDGNGLATAGRNGKVQFWDVRDGQLLFTLSHKQPWVTCSPASPLMAIGTGGDLWGQSGEEVHLVDTTFGQTVRVLPKSGDRAFFSPDGRRLASANWGPHPAGSQAVILWDVDSGQKLRVLENQGQVLGMTFSPDGSLLAIANRYGAILLWNLNDFSHAILRPATGDMAWSVAFSPEGRWLAVAMSNQEVEIWDTRDQRLVQRLPGHVDEVRSVAFSPDGTRLASGSVDGTIKLWDPSPPTIQKLIPGVKLKDFVMGHPRFSPDSRSVAAATQTGDVQILDATTPAWDKRTFLPDAGYPLAFSGDASTLLTLREKTGTVQRWDATSGDLRSTITLNTTNRRWRLSTSTPDGSRLALSDGKLIEVFETRTGHCVNQAPAPPATDSMEFSQDGQSLVLACFNTGARWDVATGRIVQTFAGHKSRVATIALSPDQKTIATGSWDHTVRLWEASTGTELGVLTGHKSTLKVCAFSPDGRTLATGSDDRTIKFWNLATLREVGSIQLDYIVWVLAFSPDGKNLAANSGRTNCRCWRAPSLAEIDAAEAKSKQP